MGAPLTIEQMITNHNIGVNLSDAATLGGKTAAEFAPKTHSHSAVDITTGTMAQARLPKASGNSQGIVALSSSTDSDATDIAATPSAVKAVKGLISGKADQSHNHTAAQVKGGTLPEPVTANSNTNYTTRQIRNIVLSTRAPLSSDGSNGDIWFQYE